MKRSPFFCTFIVILVCSCFAARADHPSARFLFAARMNGAQEAIPVGTPAIGVASLRLNSSGDTLCITITVNGLSDVITGARIYEGEPGVDGAVVKDLMPYLSGNSIQVTLTGSSLSGLTMAKMFSGNYYINVHTVAYPLGEIRGQIKLEEDKGMLVMMSGAQENPPVATVAKGLAFFMLSQHNLKLNFYVVLDSLNGPITGAHLHSGTVGTNGPVIENLMPFLSGNVISGSVDPTLYLSAILADSVYINVHTTANPGGSIRGQLHFQPLLHFDARMNGSQETPSVPTNAVGLSVFRTNYTIDTVWYDMLVTGISGPITASHIHKGPSGTAGPVLVPFPSANITGHSISGYFPLPAGAATDSIRRQIMEGGLYANVHTAANPGGEIRGQIHTTVREGYTFSITGSQEVPSKITYAYGSGLVSIDRDQTNAHFMAATTHIAPTAVHFHEAPAGVSGPVVFDLMPYFSAGGTFGYWLDTDPTSPFTAAYSARFRNDSIYLNMHTNINPAGEIRGQVGRALCTALPTTTAIHDLSATIADLRVYPNPTNGDATVSISLNQPMAATLQLTDVMGRIIWKANATYSIGRHLVALPVASLPSGLYYIRLLSTEGQITTKLLKE